MASARTITFAEVPTNFYKHYLGDYARDTAHLSVTEHGVYRLLMDHYYALLKPLPDDFAYLCRVAKCHSRHEKAALRSIRDQFFDIINCELRHTRIDQEIVKYQQNSDTNRKAIVSRWNTNRNTKPEARSQIPEVNLKPKNNNKSGSAFAPPDWIPSEAWQGFKAMRKKAGKPMTDRAEVMIVQELEKLRAAGEDAVACLAQSEMNGYLGVFPLKIKGNGGNGTAQPQPDPLCAKCGGSTGIGFIHTSDGRVCSRCRAKS